MAEKYARPQIFLIPWDPESAEHRDRLYQQRVTCGWKQDRIDKWCKYQREGCMSIHWVVLDPAGPSTAEWISQHITKYPDESAPLEDSAIAIGGHPRTSSSQRSLIPFTPIGHISVDTVASTPDPSPLLADPSSHRFHLSALYVSRAIHGSGVGSAAMRAGEHMAVSVLGAKTITLDTWDKRLITDKSKQEWRDAFEKCSPGELETLKFDPQGWYERLGYRVIRELSEHELDERSAYYYKLPNGGGWSVPSVWMEKSIE